MLLLRFKRIGIYFIESVVLLFGAILGLSLGLIFFEYLNVRDPLPVLTSALLLSFILFLYVRRKTSRFKLHYDAIRFLASRQSAIGHPRRAKLIRNVKRILLWLPSAWALTVLVAFPQVTHLFHPRAEMGDFSLRPWIFLPKLHNLSHPGSDHLLHNQVHIPWNWTILNTFDAPGRFSSVYILIDHRSPWPFGGKFRPNQDNYLSGVTINSLSPSEVVDRRQNASRWSQIEKAEHTSRIVEANGITLECSGYLSPWSTGLWVIHCETSSPLQLRNLDATFAGPKEELPAFYELLRTARSAD
jgi:hypothetical protein